MPLRAGRCGNCGQDENLRGAGFGSDAFPLTGVAHTLLPVLPGGHDDLVKGWLHRRALWQFALMMGSFELLALVIGGGVINWLMKRPLVPGWLLVYAAVFSVGTTATITWARRR